MSGEVLAVIDRIVEGRQAVLLTGDEEYIVPVEQLPDGATEGDWVRVLFGENGIVSATIDADETERRRRRIKEKMARLRGRTNNE